MDFFPESVSNLRRANGKSSFVFLLLLLLWFSLCATFHFHRFIFLLSVEFGESVGCQHWRQIQASFLPLMNASNACNACNNDTAVLPYPIIPILSIFLFPYVVHSSANEAVMQICWPPIRAEFHQKLPNDEGS